MEGIALRNVTFPTGGPESGWIGILVLDGVALATIGGGTQSGYDVIQYAKGADPGDLEAVDEAIGRMGKGSSEGGDGARRETLRDRISDLVATEWVTRNVSGILGRTAVALVEAAGVSRLVSVEVPEGGSMEGAAAHLRSVHPEAIVLNGLPLAEAEGLYVENMR
jgi:hypothetical protein